MQTEIVTHIRQQAEQATRESEQRYKQLLASVTDYVYSVTVVDGKAVATRHGPGCEAVTGYSSDEFERDQTLWYRMICEEDRPMVLAEVERILRGEAPPRLEHRIRHKNGSIRWIRNTPVPRKDSRGRVIAYDGLVYDITERKRAELALRESQERLALVIQGSNDGFWDWNLTTGEIYFSPRWKSMLGYEDGEIGKDFSAWEKLFHPDDKGRAVAEIQAYLDGEKPAFESEYRLRHKDGSYRWILARAVALRGSQGTPVRMAGSHIDLTERKQAQERLTAAYRELEANEEELKRTLEELKTAHQELKETQLQLIQAARLESVGALAAGVAHEVKNPLQTILMGLDYLGPNIPVRSENIQMVLQDMREAVMRANTITRGLLQLSAQTDFQLKAENLNVAVERALKLVNPQVIAAKVTVVQRLEPQLPRVNLDSGKIEQVFINLFINALQAMKPGGSLSVSTRSGLFACDCRLSEKTFRRFSKGERLVIAEVRDTGSGIAAAHLPKIFDPFFTTKPVGVGTGLGLSVVKKIIDLHGGGIEIENAPEGGVVVTLIFKAEPQAAASKG